MSTSGNQDTRSSSVTVTKIAHTPLVDYSEFKAVSAYIKNDTIKAPIDGVVSDVYVHKGVSVKQNQLLLEIKPGQNLTNQKSSFDISVSSPVTGIIKNITAAAGDKVHRGQTLGIVSDANSFGFVFQFSQNRNADIFAGKNIHIQLDGGSQMNGFVSVEKSLDSTILLAKVNATTSLPEGTKANVRVIRQQKSNAASLPKSAVLHDSTKTNFWVMKLIDRNKAAKVPVTIGMQTNDRMEILTPSFSSQDEILLTGNRGLPDTAIVNVSR